MPVTIITGNTTPVAWDREIPAYYRRADATEPQHRNSKATSADVLLAGAAHDEQRLNKGIIQHSPAFDNDTLAANHITPSTNGFVHTMVSAYSEHHHVVLRPEDVWFAILTQLSFYMNKNAEDLRSLFVAHQGQKKLSIDMSPGPKGLDFGEFAQQMSHLLQQNVLDPDLREWIMPNFSTTTDDDLIVGSILMMGGLQKYFLYSACIRCGMPSMTLLGEREDWEKLLARLDGLPRLGKEPTTFGLLLNPIIRRFMASFDGPADPDVLEFWARSVDRTTGSGMDHLSGWISAFCFWDSEGVCTYTGQKHWRGNLTLDGVMYGVAQTEQIPSGSMGVPVKIDNNGQEIHTRMVAGSVGIRGMRFDERFGGSSSGGEGVLMDTIQPVTGWWMFRTEHDTNPGPACQDDKVKARDPFGGYEPEQSLAAPVVEAARYEEIE